MDPTTSTAFKLHQATLLIDRLADVYLRREHGIRYAPFLVLLMVHVLGETTQQAIAQSLGVSRASITQRVSALVAEGWLTAEPHPTDARANLVAFTPAGMAKAQAAWLGLEAHQNGLDDGVDERALAQQLDRIIANGTRIVGGQ